MKTNKKTINKGFTLIELLVVISIIGLLAGLALLSFSTSQKQARDANRKSDIKQYQAGLELYANKNNGFFPSRTDGSGVAASTTLCTDLEISPCPEDTRNGEDSSYTYLYQTDGSDGGSIDASFYVLWSKLENSADYWVVCSSGVTGAVSQSGFSVSGGSCPL